MTALQIFAQATESAPDMTYYDDLLVYHLKAAGIFTLVGIIFFAACLFIIVKIAPFSIRKEIEDDQNTALGIIIGSMILGIAIILSAAIQG